MGELDPIVFGAIVMVLVWGTQKAIKSTSQRTPAQKPTPMQSVRKEQQKKIRKTAETKRRGGKGIRQ